ncbi:unnamed protein product [Tenebrio molitor]|nr:unnamed protein product [Tenebrio molitor]
MSRESKLDRRDFQGEIFPHLTALMFAENPQKNKIMSNQRHSERRKQDDY